MTTHAASPADRPRVSATPAAHTRTAVLAALAEPTRYAMLELLLGHGRPVCVCDITAEFALRQPTVSHHLKVLRDAGLVNAERRGVWSYYWPTEPALRLLGALRRSMPMEGDKTPVSWLPSSEEVVTQRVHEKYAALAVAASQAGPAGAVCGCGGGSAADSCCSGVSDGLYDAAEAGEVSAGALRSSLGCANPTALADLHPGDRVLDLGSGGGLDVLLTARRVGPAGMAIGLDMTDEMLALAQRHQTEAGVGNAVFLKGRIEDIPLPDGSVDVVISNCVINLVPDKRRALAEAWRVLRPGGRLAVADVVRDGPVREELARSMEAWVGCISGASERGDYLRMLHDVGFAHAEITIVRRYTAAEAGLNVASLPGGWQDEDGRIASAFVRAMKPDRAEAASRRSESQG